MIDVNDVVFLNVVDGEIEVNFLVRCNNIATATALSAQIIAEMAVVTVSEYAASTETKKALLKELANVYEKDDEDGIAQKKYLNTKPTNENTISDVACFRYIGKHIFEIQTGA